MKKKECFFMRLFENLKQVFDTINIFSGNKTKKYINSGTNSGIIGDVTQEIHNHNREDTSLAGLKRKIYEMRVSDMECIEDTSDGLTYHSKTDIKFVMKKCREKDAFYHPSIPKSYVDSLLHDPMTTGERFEFYYDQHKIDTIFLISFDAGRFYYPAPRVPGYQVSMVEYEFAKKITQLLHNGDLTYFNMHEKEFRLEVVDKPNEGTLT
jgi:hypothetical protein